VRERYPDSDTNGVVDYTVAEWSAERDDWVVLHPGDVIEDPALLLPIPVEALTDAVASEDAVARALLAKKNRVLQEHAARERHEVRLAAARKYLYDIVEHRKIALDAAQQARIDACDDLETLERWLVRAIEVQDASALLG
jgi:hypothetical protein